MVLPSAMRKSREVPLTILASIALSGSYCIAAESSRTLKPQGQPDAAIHRHALENATVLRGGFGEGMDTLLFFIGLSGVIFFMARSGGE